MIGTVKDFIALLKEHYPHAHRIRFSYSGMSGEKDFMGTLVETDEPDGRCISTYPSSKEFLIEAEEWANSKIDEHYPYYADSDNGEGGTLIVLAEEGKAVLSNYYHTLEMTDNPDIDIVDAEEVEVDDAA